MDYFDDIDFKNFFDKDFSIREFNRFIREVVKQGKKNTLEQFCDVYALNKKEIHDLLISVKKCGQKELSKKIRADTSLTQGIRNWLNQNPETDSIYNYFYS